MQKKINYIIWGICLCLIVVFGINYFINKNSVKEYRFTYNKPYLVDVRIYLKDDNKGNELIKILKGIKVSKNNHDYLNTIKTKLEANKELYGNELVKYLIQSDNDVLVGNHYSNSKYKVATYYTDNSLFKIFDVENKLILTEDYNNNKDYDRIIIIGDVASVNKLKEEIANVKEIGMHKKLVNNHDNIEIYWLKNNKVVDHYMASNQ